MSKGAVGFVAGCQPVFPAVLRPVTALSTALFGTAAVTAMRPVHPVGSPMAGPTEKDAIR